MTAIYKKELRSLLVNMSGAVALAVMLLTAGLMFRYYNLYNGVLTYHYAVSNSILMFYIVVPVLSMRVFAEEKRQKTDQLLLTSPVSFPKIVLGKYLALVTIFAIPVAVMCAGPLVMLRFGAETLRWDYACILMFFLMGCAYLSVGMFLSATTENPVIAAILCIAFVFATQMMSSVFTIIGASGVSSLIFLLVLTAAAGLLTRYMTGSSFWGVTVFGVMSVVFLILFRVRPEWFSGRTESVLRVLDFYTHFQDVTAGSLEISNLVYFASYVVLGIVLTIALGGRNGVHRAYALVMAAVISAALAVGNLVAAELPAGISAFDLTDQKLYSLSAETEELLDTLEEDVTLHFITENGQEDEGVEKLLDAYEGASPHIEVHRVDAVRNPTFAKQLTDENVSLNSVIAVSGDRVRTADYSSFYQYSYSGMSYGVSAYDAEGRITSAISFVSGEEEAKIYYTTGHGEIALGGEMTDAMEKAHIASAEINLLSETIPADCSALLVFAPEQDFTEAEADKVLKYLYDGGHAMLVTMPYLVTGAKTPHFDSIMEAYGISRPEGLVMEGDDSRFVQAPYLLVPGINENAEVTGGIGNSNIVCALAEALEYDEKEDDAWSVTSLLYTSEDAYLKTDIDSTLEKTAGDPSDAYILGAEIEQTFTAGDYGQSDIQEDREEEEEPAETKQTKLLCFTTPCAFSSDALSSLIQQYTALPEGNSLLISASLKYLTDRDTAVSVPAKLLSTPQTTISTGTVNLLGTLAMIVLPALTLAAGFLVWYLRRRR